MYNIPRWDHWLQSFGQNTAFFGGKLRCWTYGKNRNSILSYLVIILLNRVSQRTKITQLSSWQLKLESHTFF